MQPPEFASSRVHDFFDITYTSLSHKILDATTFAADVDTLKERFTNPEASDFIFKDAYAKDVPADGWPIYAERIWVLRLPSSPFSWIYRTHPPP